MVLELAAYHEGTHWLMRHISLAKAVTLRPGVVGAPQYWWFNEDGRIDWWPLADKDFEVRQCRDGTGIWTPAKRLSTGITA